MSQLSETPLGEKSQLKTFLKNVRLCCLHQFTKLRGVTFTLKGAARVYRLVPRSIKAQRTQHRGAQPPRQGFETFMPKLRETRRGAQFVERAVLPGLPIHRRR